MSIPEILGWAVITAAAIIAAAGLVLVIIVWRPRLHAGKPKNHGELIFSDAQGPIHTMVLRRWLGISHRTNAKWFFGLMTYRTDSARTRHVIKR